MGVFYECDRCRASTKSYTVNVRNVGVGVLEEGKLVWSSPQTHSYYLCDNCIAKVHEFIRERSIKKDDA